MASTATAPATPSRSEYVAAPATQPVNSMPCVFTATGQLELESLIGAKDAAKQIADQVSPLRDSYLSGTLDRKTYQIKLLGFNAACRAIGAKADVLDVGAMLNEKAELKGEKVGRPLPSSPERKAASMTDGVAAAQEMKIYAPGRYLAAQARELQKKSTAIKLDDETVFTPESLKGFKSYHLNRALKELSSGDKEASPLAAREQKAEGRAQEMVEECKEKVARWMRRALDTPYPDRRGGYERTLIIANEALKKQYGFHLYNVEALLKKFDELSRQKREQKPGVEKKEAA